MSPRLGDLRENASEKLEDVEGLPLRIGGEGVVMRGLSLIEDSASPFCPVDPRQGEGASQEVACEPLEAIGVLRPDGGRVVHGKAATMERAQSSIRSSLKRSLRFSKRRVLCRNSFSATAVSM